MGHTDEHMNPRIFDVRLSCYQENHSTRPPTEVVIIPNHHHRSIMPGSIRLIIEVSCLLMPSILAARFAFAVAFALLGGFKVVVGNIEGGL